MRHSRKAVLDAAARMREVVRGKYGVGLLGFAGHQISAKPATMGQCAPAPICSSARRLLPGARRSAGWTTTRAGRARPATTPVRTADAIVITWDQAGGTLATIVNGEMRVDYDAGGWSVTPTDMQIGAGTAPADAILDELAIWMRVLGADEIS